MKKSSTFTDDDLRIIYTPTMCRLTEKRACRLVAEFRATGHRWFTATRDPDDAEIDFVVTARSGGFLVTDVMVYPEADREGAAL